MTTVFLFMQFADNSGCKCLKLDSTGQVINDFAFRTYSEIKTIQNQSSTIIVLPTIQTSIHNIKLPKISNTKARSAISFALEDQIAEPITELHFSFANNFYTDGKYLVVVIASKLLNSYIQLLADNNIFFSAVTIDFFALKENEVCKTKDYFLVANSKFNGSLLYSFEKESELVVKDVTIHDFIESDDSTSKTPTKNYYTWVAKRLQGNPFINLCQAGFQRKTNLSSLTKNMATLSSTLILSFISFWLISKAVYFHQLSNYFYKNEQEINNIYYTYFPHAKTVISPRFRITQLLKNNKNGKDDTFWVTLNALFNAYLKASVKIEAINFNNSKLTFNLHADNFEQLVQFENILKSKNIKVIRREAESQANKAVATMDLFI